MSTPLAVTPSPGSPAGDAWRVLSDQLADGRPVPCQEQDTEMWWATGLDQRKAVETAVAGCWSCRVRPACLQYALAAREGHGIWGGLTVPERRRLATRERDLPQVA